MTSLEIDAKHTIRRDIERPNRSLMDRAGGFGTATLHEAFGKSGDLPPSIRSMTPGLKICGPAVTVHSPGGDNLWLHRAIYAALPGDVLVVSCSGRYEHGYWGEIMSTAARVARLNGLVIDGCVRDSALLRQMGFPVFARGICIRGTGKDFGARGWINHPILIGDVRIQPGDVIVGDEDGVVSVPQSQLGPVLAAAQQRADEEARIISALEAGARTLDLYGWARDGDR